MTDEKPAGDADPGTGPTAEAETADAPEPCDPVRDRVERALDEAREELEEFAARARRELEGVEDRAREEFERLRQRVADFLGDDPPRTGGATEPPRKE